MITIKDFSKQYGQEQVLSIPQLKMSGGVYWIKGHNGSGKTTFFKSLGGLIPCQGVIQFSDGVSLHDHPVQYRKRVNFSEAEPLYPGFLTPKDLIRFIGKLKGASLDQQQSLFDTFGISDFQSKPFSACSSGMVKKVSLAQAFLGTPQLIILDEPLITLDERSRTVLIDLIRTVTRSGEVICLLSSHQSLDNNLLGLSGSYEIRDKNLVPL